MWEGGDRKMILLKFIQERCENVKKKQTVYLSSVIWMYDGSYTAEIVAS